MSLSRIALFLLEGSLWYRCACRLRLAESCIFFFFLFSKRCTWLLAVASEFLGLHKLCVGHLRSVLRAFSSSSTRCVLLLPQCMVTRALSSELLSFSTRCVWMGRCCFESVCLLSRARHWRRNPAGTTHVVRPCFQGLQVDVCTFSLVLCFVTLLAGGVLWLIRPVSTRLFRVMTSSDSYGCCYFY